MISTQKEIKRVTQMGIWGDFQGITGMTKGGKNWMVASYGNPIFFAIQQLGD